MTLISMLREYDSSYAVRTLLYLLLDLLRRHITPESGYNFDYDNIITESEIDLPNIIERIPDRAFNTIFEPNSPEYPEYMLYVEPFLLINGIGSIFRKSRLFTFYREINTLNEISPTTGANNFLHIFYSKFVTGLYLSFRSHIINKNKTFNIEFDKIKMIKISTIFAGDEPPKKGGSKIIYKNKTKKRKTRKVKKSNKKVRKTYRKK